MIWELTYYDAVWMKEKADKDCKNHNPVPTRNTNASAAAPNDSTTVKPAVKQEDQPLSGPSMPSVKNIEVPLVRLPTLSREHSRAAGESPNDSMTVEPAVKREDNFLSLISPHLPPSLRMRISKNGWEIPLVPLPRLSLPQKHSKAAKESGSKKAEPSSDTNCVEKLPSLQDQLAMVRKQAKGRAEAAEASGPARKRMRK